MKSKGRSHYKGSKHYHRMAQAGERDESLYGSEGDALKANWMPIAEVLEATRSAAANPDNKYNYFDEERLNAAEKVYEMLSQKTANDKLLRHRASLLIKDPETGGILSSKIDNDRKGPIYFPGGGVYEDESTEVRNPSEEQILEGVNREALEELGFKINDPRIVGAYGTELDDNWKSHVLKSRGVPYAGRKEHYVLADRGEEDRSLYNIEGDAFEGGEYLPPEEILRALSAVGPDNPFKGFKDEQSRIIREHLMNQKTSSDNSTLYRAYLIGKKLAHADFGDNDGTSDDLTHSDNEVYQKTDPKDFCSSEDHGNMTPSTNINIWLGHTEEAVPSKTENTPYKRDHLERT